MKKDRTYNDIQNTTPKIKNLATWTPLLIRRHFWDNQKEQTIVLNKIGSDTWQNGHKASEYKLCIPRLEKQPTTVPDTRYMQCSDDFGIRVHNQLSFEIVYDHWAKCCEDTRLF